MDDQPISSGLVDLLKQDLTSAGQSGIKILRKPPEITQKWFIVLHYKQCYKCNIIPCSILTNVEYLSAGSDAHDDSTWNCR